MFDRENYENSKDAALRHLAKAHRDLEKYAARDDANDFVIKQKNEFIQVLVEFVNDSDNLVSFFELELKKQYSKGFAASQRQTEKANELERRDPRNKEAIRQESILKAQIDFNL